MSRVWKKRLGEVTEGVRVVGGKASREESRVSGGGADDPCPELQAIFLTRRVTFVQPKGEESFALTLTFTGLSSISNWAVTRALLWSLGEWKQTLGGLRGSWTITV